MLPSLTKTCPPQRRCHGSEVSSQEVLHDPVLKGYLRLNPLQLLIFLLDFLQGIDIKRYHFTVFSKPLLKGALLMPWSQQISATFRPASAPCSSAMIFVSGIFYFLIVFPLSLHVGGKLA